MKRHTDWMDEEDLFNDVYQALEDAGMHVRGGEEQGAYGESGTITIRAEDGRTFALEIHELS